MSFIVLITGANSGIGYATTKVIADASEKYHVIMAGRNLQNLESAKTEIEATGIKGSLSTVQLDLTDDESISQAAAQVESQFGHLDALVNNAGISSRESNLRKRLTESLTVNVVGTAVVAEAFLPLLKKSKSSYSIYVSSGMGSIAIARDPEHPFFKAPATEAYQCSKSALNMIMVREWQETRDTQVKTFGLCPGFVRSNLRGKSEAAISGGGLAGDPMDSGRTILAVIEGKRDADAGRVVHKDGIYQW